MGKMDGFSEADQQRIKTIMRRLVEGQVASGAIAATDEAIKAAMPQAFEDAKAAILAADEFLCG